MNDESGAAGRLSAVADGVPPRPDLHFVRRSLVDDIGTELSREFAQGNPFEPFDRTYVLKAITRVLDAARERAQLAAGSVSR